MAGNVPETYPYNIPVSFHFSVKITGFDNDAECAFRDVEGLSVKMDLESVEEGGVNNYVHKFPKKAQYKDLVLKRGLLLGSQATAWVKNAITNFSFEPKSIYISLLDETNKPSVKWWLVNAYPIGLEVSAFNANDNSLVIETLTLAYDYFVRTG